MFAPTKPARTTENAELDKMLPYEPLSIAEDAGYERALIDYTDAAHAWERAGQEDDLPEEVAFMKADRALVAVIDAFVARQIAVNISMRNGQKEKPTA